MGRFQPGNPGRQKGAKNKFRLTKAREYFIEQGIDPIKEMVALMNSIPDPVVRLGFWLKIYPWVEIRSQKIETIGERSSGDPTGLEKRADGHLLEILHPDKLNGTDGTST